MDLQSNIEELEPLGSRMNIVSVLNSSDENGTTQNYRDHEMTEVVCDRIGLKGKDFDDVTEGITGEMEALSVGIKQPHALAQTRKC